GGSGGSRGGGATIGQGNTTSRKIKSEKPAGETTTATETTAVGAPAEGVVRPIIVVSESGEVVRVISSPSGGEAGTGSGPTDELFIGKVTAKEDMITEEELADLEVGTYAELRRKLLNPATDPAAVVEGLPGETVVTEEKTGVLEAFQNGAKNLWNDIKNWFGGLGL
ncbi:MAG: hypothetical protein KAS92_03690, partial [Candidatus Omnitrophica bacterium]|nr:hypothetical protein [Candidatus Omnitrophota bacterium]